MKAEIIRKIMKDHFITSDSEAQEALDFVRDLIDAEVEHTEKTEPYATRTINTLKEANYKLMDLLDGLSEE